MPVLPLMVGTFTGSQADQTFWFGAVDVRLRHRQLLRRADPRCAVRPLRPPAGAADRLLRPGAELLRHRAGAPRCGCWSSVRLVGGAMQANVAVANAYVADITPPEDRARRFGLLGAMFGIGFILGPVMGGLLGDDRPAPAVLRRRHAGADQLAATATSCCRSRCRRSGGGRSSGGAPNPVAALRSLAALKGIGPLVRGDRRWPASRSSSCTRPGCSTPRFKFGWGPRRERLVAVRGGHHVGARAGRAAQARC